LSLISSFHFSRVVAQTSLFIVFPSSSFDFPLPHPSPMLQVESGRGLAQDVAVEYDYLKTRGVFWIDNIELRDHVLGHIKFQGWSLEYKSISREFSSRPDFQLQHQVSKDDAQEEQEAVEPEA